MNKIRFSDYLKDYLEFYNISNKDFANRIGITQKHLIDILSNKCDLSVQVINSISLVTGISKEFILNIECDAKMDDEIECYLKLNDLSITQYLNKFSYKKLIDNKWIDFVNLEDKNEIVKDILKFLRINDPTGIELLNDNAFYKSKNDRKELLFLWLEKCYRETFNQKVSDYKKENIYKLVEFINNEALNNRFDENKLIKEFNNNGIFLVIQDDLPGSKIRGAFRVNRNVPSIYITRKHKRIADIYFALLHELAHCKTNFNKAKAMNLVSFIDDNDMEEKADIQAFDWMVNNEYYNIIKDNKDYDIDNENIYPKSFIVYRLAFDKKISFSSEIYQKYNIIIEL